MFADTQQLLTAECRYIVTLNLLRDVICYFLKESQTEHLLPEKTSIICSIHLMQTMHLNTQIQALRNITLVCACGECRSMCVFVGKQAHCLCVCASVKRVPSKKLISKKI